MPGICLFCIKRVLSGGFGVYFRRIDERIFSTCDFFPYGTFL